MGRTEPAPSPGWSAADAQQPAAATAPLTLAPPPLDPAAAPAQAALEWEQRLPEWLARADARPEHDDTGPGATPLSRAIAREEARETEAAVVAFLAQPFEAQTPAAAAQLVSRHAQAFDRLPVALQHTLEVAVAIVRQQPERFVGLPEALRRDRRVALGAVSADGGVYPLLEDALQEDAEILEAALRECPRAVLDCRPELTLDARQTAWALSADSGAGWGDHLHRLAPGGAERLAWENPLVLQHPGFRPLVRALLSEPEALRSFVAQGPSHAGELFLAVVDVYAETQESWGSPEVMGALAREAVSAPEALFPGLAKLAFEVGRSDEPWGYFREHPEVWDEVQRQAPELSLAARGVNPGVIGKLFAKNDVPTLPLTLERATQACGRWPEGWTQLPLQLREAPEPALAALRGAPELAAQLPQALLEPGFLEAAVRVNPFVFEFLPEATREALEREHPSVVAPYRALKADLERLDLRQPERFHGEVALLRELIENRLRPRAGDVRPVASVLVARGDESGALKSLLFKDLHPSHRILFHEVEGPAGMGRALTEARAQGGADVVVLMGHGVQHAVPLADVPEGAALLGAVRSTQLERVAATRLRESVKPGGAVVLVSCSTGSSENRDLNVASGFAQVVPHAHVFAPRRLVLNHVSWELDSAGRFRGVRFTEAEPVPHRLTYHVPPSQDWSSTPRR